MNDVVIKVENLSKRYRLGELHKQTNSFREKITNALRHKVHSAKRKVNNPMLQNAIPSSLNDIRHALSPMPEVPDHIYALRNVSFEVKRGEIIGIIGRNGAGKTTLLKILSRITKPTEGKAWINGRVGSLLEVGTGFHAELTGRENIFLNGAILGMRKAEIKRKFDEIVEFAEVDKFIDTPVKRYSNGMYVRLAFAVAAHLETEILLVDEVLAVGDVEFQRKCIGKMGEIATKGRTVLFVSHNMAAITVLCTRTYLMKKGSIVTEGDASTVISQYVSEIDYNINKPLSEYIHTGNGLARITGIRFYHEDGKASNAFLSGESCVIVLECQSYHNISKTSFSIGIYDYLARQLSLLDSSVTEQFFSLNTGHNEVVCLLPCIPLSPGKYLINVAIIQGKELIDGVARCAEFTVEAGNFYGTGKLPESGSILIQHEWHSESLNSEKK